MGMEFKRWEAVAPPDLAIANAGQRTASFSMPAMDAKVRAVFEEESFTDPDGKVYKTVKIGEQVWMAENLDLDDYGGIYYNNASIPPFPKAGRLYPFTSIRRFNSAGWRLPTQEEVQALIWFAGGQEAACEKLKATSGWANNGLDAYGFAALPAGMHKQQFAGIDAISNFQELYVSASWWTSTIGLIGGAWAAPYSLSINDNLATLEYHTRYSDYNYKLSVRLVKDSGGGKLACLLIIIEPDCCMDCLSEAA